LRGLTQGGIAYAGTFAVAFARRLYRMGYGFTRAERTGLRRSYEHETNREHAAGELPHSKLLKRRSPEASIVKGSIYLNERGIP